MRLFKTLVKGVITYGAKNWGWREWVEIEEIIMKYMRWSIKLSRTTPWYTIRKDTGVGKITINAVRGAIKFEEKLISGKEDSLERMC